MGRALLLAVTMFAAAACGKQDGSQEVAANAPAGTVTEVVGSVTVAGKPLAVGATVSADDEISTGADGRFAIVLAHNHATWQLGPNRKARARESVAWGMAMVQGSAAANAAIATSAGRNGERAAADTDVSAPALNQERGGPPTAAAAAAREEAPAPPTGAATPPGGPAPGAPAQASPPPPQNQPAPPTAAAPVAPPAPPPPPPPAAKEPAHGAPSRRQPDSNSLADETEVAPRIMRGTDPGADHAKSTLRANAKVRSCLTHAATATLVVKCASGKCSLISVDPADDEKCLREAIPKIGLPAGDYTVTVEVKAPAR